MPGPWAAAVFAILRIEHRPAAYRMMRGSFATIPLTERMQPASWRRGLAGLRRLGRRAGCAVALIGCLLAADLPATVITVGSPAPSNFKFYTETSITEKIGLLYSKVIVFEVTLQDSKGPYTFNCGLVKGPLTSNSYWKPPVSNGDGTTTFSFALKAGDVADLHKAYNDGHAPAWVSVANATDSITVADTGNYQTRYVDRQGTVTTPPNQPAFGACYGVAIDDPYIVDAANNAIYRQNPDGSYSLLAGGSAGPADGTGAAAQFNFPTSVTFDRFGNAYVADRMNHAIRMVTPAGVVTTIAGSPGVSGYADGTGTAARFNQPFGVACDLWGNVYVADLGNVSIRKVAAGGVVTTVAGLHGSYGSADGVGSAARFNNPQAVAVDPSGNLYVADNGNSTIRKISPAGVVSTLAGVPGNTGSTDGSLPHNTLNTPTSTAVDAAGNVYVANEADATIRVVAPGGATTLLAGVSHNQGHQDGTGGGALFMFPTALALGPDGNLYVADGGYIRKVTPGGVVTTVAGSGASTTADGTGSGASFNNARGICVDASGNIYVAEESDVIRLVAAGGVVTTLAGQPFFFGNHDGTGSAAQFNFNYGQMIGMAVDPSGNVWIADTYNYTVRMMTPGGTVTTVAGSGSPGYADGTGAAAAFGVVYGLAFNAAGNLCIADSGSSRIRLMTTGGVVSTFSGNGTAGYADAAAASAEFRSPGGLAADASGTLYVADAGNNLVRKLDSLGAASTISGTPPGLPAPALFSFPAGVAVDGLGNVFVADTSNSTIRMINQAAGTVTTLAGSAGLTGSANGTGSAARFNKPKGLGLDGSGTAVIDLGNLVPAAVTTAPGSQSVGVGGTVSLTVQAAGYPAPQYQWLLNGVPLTDGGAISGAGTATLTITGAQAANQGSYTVNVDNALGSDTSAAATVTVSALQAQTISFTSPASSPATLAPLTLGATATSGLPVSFSVVSGPATVNGTLLTFTGAGTVVVEADQAGDGLAYAAASPVQKTLTLTSGFAAWQGANFSSASLANPAVSGPAAVTGQDGLSNLAKYALGLNPAANVTSGLPALTLSAGNWTYSFTKPTAVTDVAVAVQYSTDLATWSTAANGALTGMTVQTISAGGTDTWTVSCPASSAPTLFFRVLVTQ